MSFQRVPERSDEALGLAPLNSFVYGAGFFGITLALLVMFMMRKWHSNKNRKEEIPETSQTSSKKPKRKIEVKAGKKKVAHGPEPVIEEPSQPTLGPEHTVRMEKTAKPQDKPTAPRKKMVHTEEVTCTGKGVSCPTDVSTTESEVVRRKKKKEPKEVQHSVEVSAVQEQYDGFEVVNSKGGRRAEVATARKLAEEEWVSAMQRHEEARLEVEAAAQAAEAAARAEVRAAVAAQKAEKRAEAAAARKPVKGQRAALQKMAEEERVAVEAAAKAKELAEAAAQKVKHVGGETSDSSATSLAGPALDEKRTLLEREEEGERPAKVQEAKAEELAENVRKLAEEERAAVQMALKAEEAAAQAEALAEAATLAAQMEIKELKSPEAKAVSKHSPNFVARCVDFDLYGVCPRGAMCPWSHSLDVCGSAGCDDAEMFERFAEQDGTIIQEEEVMYKPVKQPLSAYAMPFVPRAAQDDLIDQLVDLGCF